MVSKKLTERAEVEKMVNGTWWRNLSNETMRVTLKEYLETKHDYFTDDAKEYIKQCLKALD